MKPWTRTTVFYIKSNENPPCPDCGGQLEKKDWVPRIRKKAGGKKECYKIERRKCTNENCGRTHRVLADIWVPNKHYEASLIEDVIDEVVSEDDLEMEDYPCAATMARWRAWAESIVKNAEGYLRSEARRVLNLTDRFLGSHVSLLKELKKRNPYGWLAILLRVMYNAGGKARPPD